MCYYYTIYREENLMNTIIKVLSLFSVLGALVLTNVLVLQYYQSSENEQTPQVQQDIA